MDSVLCKELRLSPPIAVILADELPPAARPFAPVQCPNHCSLHALKLAQAGESICFCRETPGCPGMKFGLGFVDEIRIPGGGKFEYFLSCGQGPGFPEGEKVKKNPGTAMAFYNGLPKQVHRSKYVMFQPLTDDSLARATLVVVLVNPDQLSALVHLYAYESGATDEVFAAMCSGCASILRIPLAELTKPSPRGVIGLIDIFARPNFGANLVALTVPARKFAEMEDNSKDCFFQARTWNGIKQRLAP